MWAGHSLPTNKKREISKDYAAIRRVDGKMKMIDLLDDRYLKEYYNERLY